MENESREIRDYVIRFLEYEKLLGLFNEVYREELNKNFEEVMYETYGKRYLRKSPTRSLVLTQRILSELRNDFRHPETQNVEIIGFHKRFKKIYKDKEFKD